MSAIKPLEQLGVSADWRVDHDYQYIGVLAEDTLQIMPSYNRERARLEGFTPNEWRANCRLAAQAPRLYAALYRLYQATPDTDVGELGHALQEARAAMIGAAQG